MKWHCDDRSCGRLQCLMMQLQPYLIGLWRFKEIGLPLKWCATFCWKGRYYDVQQQETPMAAVKAVGAKLDKLKRRAR